MDLEVYRLLTKENKDELLNILLDFTSKKKQVITIPEVNEGNTNVDLHFRSIKRNSTAGYAGGLFYPFAELVRIKINRGSMKRGPVENYLEHLFFIDFKKPGSILFFCESKQVPKGYILSTKEQLQQAFCGGIVKLFKDNGVEDASLKELSARLSGFQIRKIKKEIVQKSSLFTLESEKLKVTNAPPQKRNGLAIDIVDKHKKGNPRSYSKEEAQALVDGTYESLRQFKSIEISYDEERAKKGIYGRTAMDYAISELSEDLAITYRRSLGKGEQESPRTLSVYRNAKVDIKLKAEPTPDGREEILSGLSNLAKSIRWQLNPNNLPESFVEEMGLGSGDEDE